MIRKIFLVLFVVALIFGLSFNADAATKAKIATMDNSPTPPGAISDASSGDTAEVDSEGRLYTREMGGHSIAVQWGDGILVTGECVVHEVIISGPTAGDNAAIYDALSATGTAKLDPALAANTSSVATDTKGALFSTGVYADATDADVKVTVIYDAL